MRKAYNPSDGTVRKFGQFTSAQMEKFKTDSELQMPLDGLMFCAGYYRSLQQDPTVDELRFLDKLSQITATSDRILVSELHTNDPIVAETYSDMMKKLSDLSYDSPRPPSLDDLMGLATAYMKRIGVADKQTDFTPSFRPPEALDAASTGLQESSIVLSLSSTYNAPANGDALILIHRGSIPNLKYSNTLSQLLSIREITDCTKQIYTVPSQGLLSLLLSVGDGFAIDLQSLSLGFPITTPMLMIEKFSGYVVLAVSKDQTSTVVSQAKALGLRALPFAVQNGSQQFDLVCSNDERMSFDTQFLRQIPSLRTVAAKLPDEPIDQIATVSSHPIGLSNCKYISEKPSSTYISGEYGIIFGAHADLSCAPFRGAMRAALASVLSATAGCTWKSNQLALSLRYPSQEWNSESISGIVSALLGLYRMQCELGIPAVIREIREDASLSSVALDAYSISARDAIPSKLIANGNRLYCVAPVFTERGIPDFNALRQLLKELSLYREKGTVQGFGLVCGESVLDALVAMETDELTFHLTDQASLVGEPIPLAILLLSNESLPYHEIGYVKQKEPKSQHVLPQRLPKNHEAFNQGEEYEILIVAKPTDRDAICFSKILNAMGFFCTLMSENASEEQFAKQMMNSQIVFLCGDVALPISDRVRFAVHVIQLAGGAVLQLGTNENAIADLADQRLLNGISMDILQQIFAKNVKNEIFSEKSKEN